MEVSITWSFFKIIEGNEKSEAYSKLMVASYFIEENHIAINPLFYQVFGRKEVDVSSCEFLFSAIGHEMRHAWQAKQVNELWQKQLHSPLDISDSNKINEYFNREIEIDAYAFQDAMLKFLGFEQGIVFDNFPGNNNTIYTNLVQQLSEKNQKQWKQKFIQLSRKYNFF